MSAHRDEQGGERAQGEAACVVATAPSRGRERDPEDADRQRREEPQQPQVRRVEDSHEGPTQRLVGRVLQAPCATRIQEGAAPEGPRVVGTNMNPSDTVFANAASETSAARRRRVSKR